jgi:hypothetical protein
MSTDLASTARTKADWPGRALLIQILHTSLTLFFSSPEVDFPGVERDIRSQLGSKIAESIQSHIRDILS